MKLLLITLGAIAALTCTVGNASAANKKVICLNLVGDLFDKAEVLLSDRGLKIKNRLGCIYWSQEKPDFFYLVNPENKTYYEESAKEYVHHLRQDSTALKYTRIERQPKALLEGMKADLVTAFLSNKKGQEVKVAEIKCLKNTGLPASVNHIWCTLIGLPEKDFSLPVDVFQSVRNWNSQDAFKSGRQKWVQVLSVRNVGRKTVAETLLTVPANYKAAKDKASLYLSTDGDLKEKDLEDFFRSTPKKK